MVPASFDQENMVLDPPPQMQVEECEPLPVFRGEQLDGKPVFISCWKLTKEELEEITRTGRVWIIVLGNVMPLICPTGKNPFEG